MNLRIWSMAMAMAAILALFSLRLFQIQIVDGQRYQANAEQARQVTVMPPKRGRILDRAGAVIADTANVYDLAVIFRALDVRGRARLDVPFWRLDDTAFDALCADLGLRLHADAQALKAALEPVLANDPAVALRRGGGLAQATALIAVPRALLAPGTEKNVNATVAAADAADLATLAESDLLDDDPRDTIARVLSQGETARGDEALQVISDEEFQDACAAIDRDLDLGEDHVAAVLDPFIPDFTATLPLTMSATSASPGPAVSLHLRVVIPDRRAEAEAALAAALDDEPEAVHDRLTAALAAAHRPGPAGTLVYGIAADAGKIAALLPDELVAGGRMPIPIPLTGLPTGLGRVFVVQGDPVRYAKGDGPPPAPGLYARLLTAMGSACATDPLLMQALLEKHADRLTVKNCERDYRVHHLILDPVRYDRLCAGVLAALNAGGVPTTAAELKARLADARRRSDRAWAGQSHRDAIAFLRDIPRALAERFDGAGAEPPADLLDDYDDAGAEMPGLTVTTDITRTYPFPGAGVHWLGQLGRADGDPAPELTGVVLPGSLTGRSGLERIYDAELRGVPGERVTTRGADGMRVVRDLPAQPGRDLTTEIDLELQVLAEDSLVHAYDLAVKMGCATDRMDRARAIGHGRAGFVLMDCHTGGILACASAPGYTQDDLRTKFKELLADPGEPLHDHACEPEQPPGSSFKIITALACLDHATMQPDEELYCQGYMAKQGDKLIMRDHAPAGTYDLPHAIQASSNVYFATMGARLGAPLLCAYALGFGMGSDVALDVDSQRPGRIPTPDRLPLPGYRPKEPHWSVSDTWRFSIGQFATASPLQCVTIAAAVANGGHIVRPFLVRPESGPPAVRDLRVRADWLDQVRHGMELVTENEAHATGKLLVLEGAAHGIKVAAKTGTAEWGRASADPDRFPDHAWMIGYAPADHPTVAFACFIHSGTFGGQACSPVVKRILEAYFAKYGRAGHSPQ